MGDLQDLDDLGDLGDLADLEDFQLSSKLVGEVQNVKISINQGQNDNFERIFTIPMESVKNELKANFVNNRLYLRW